MERNPFILLSLLMLVTFGCARSPNRAMYEKSPKVVSKPTKKKVIKKTRSKNHRIQTQKIKSQASADKPYDPTDPSLIASFKNDEPTDSADVVSIKENLTRPENKKLTSEADDSDLVFYDYGAPSIKKDKKEASQSPSVAVASQASNQHKTLLDQLISDQKTKEANPAVKVQNQANSLVSNRVDQVISREMNDLGSAQALATQKAMDSIRQQMAAPSKQVVEDGISIKPFIFHLGDSSSDHMKNYQVISSYGQDEYFNDDIDGEVNLSERKVGRTGEYKGVIVGTGFVRTNFSVPLEVEESLFEIPVPSIDSVGRYLEQNSLNGYGAMLMVEKVDNIVDVDVDHDYEYRILLDSNMREVDSLNKAQYIYFLGLEPGNTLIKYLFSNGDIVSRISLMIPDELTFDRPHFTRAESRVFKFYQNNTMGKTLEEMQLDIDQVGYFDQKLVKEKVGLNAIKLRLPKKVSGTPYYLKLKHLNDDLFFGIKDDEKIVVPSREYLISVLDAFRIQELVNQCLIQVKFDKPLVDLSYRAESEEGPVNTDLIFLDQDGLFRDEFSPLSSSVFILGYQNGRISLKLTHPNDEVTLVNSYCTNNTYLLEQR